MMAPTRGRKLVVDMGRREFTTLLGGAAAAWPLAARAEQPAMPVVGFLGPALDTRQHWLTAFRRGLIAEGFVEGQNVTIEYRSADGAERLPELAADLVRRQVAVIFASGPPAALAAKRATLTIPIVFLSGGDPLQMGLVSRFHRPDGNVTGFYFLATELVGKRLALLHELLPGAKRVAVLVNPSNAATAEPTVRDVAVAGREFSLAIQVFNASTSGEIDAVFAAFSSWRPEALLDRLLFVGLYRLLLGRWTPQDHYPSDAVTLAPGWVPSLLALEIPTARRAAVGTNGYSPLDPRDEHRKPTLGRAPDPWGTTQARHQCRTDHGCEVHGKETGAAIAGLEDLTAQSCQWERADVESP
jgi:ABC transporter substrate binding protein